MPRGIKGSGKAAKGVTHGKASDYPEGEIDGKAGAVEVDDAGKAAAPAVTASTGSQDANGDTSTAALARKYKAQGLSMKDAYAAALNDNPGIKKASFAASYYKKEGLEAPAGGAPAAKTRKPRGPNKPKDVVKVSTGLATAVAVHSVLSPLVRQITINAIKEQIKTLQSALIELEA